MQGERSAIGPLPEILAYDHGSTSNDAGIGQQICWNNLQTSAHNMLPDYITSSSEPSSNYLNTMHQEGQNLSGWNVGESSSGGTQNHTIHNERKTEHGWPSSMVTCGGTGPVSEEQQFEPVNTLSLNNVNVNHSSSQISNAPLFVQNSSNVISQDLDMNAEFVGHSGGDCQLMDCSNAYKSDVSENSRIPSASSSSYPFGLPSGSGGFLLEENDGRSGCSLEGRRLSCKRKTLEGFTGQSSVSGSSSYFQPAESNVWRAVPSRYNAGSNLSISTPSDNIISTPPENIHGFSPSGQVNARLGLGAGDDTSESPLALNVAGNAESSQRNYRARMNPSRQPDIVPINVFSTGSTVGHSNVSSQQQSSRLLPLNNSLDMRSPSAADRPSPQRHSVSMHTPALRRTPHSSRWNGGSRSRVVHSSSSGERDAMLHDESDPINLPSNISEHPMFMRANEMRNSAQNSTNWSLTGGATSIAGNVTSTSRTGPTASSSGVNPLSGPNWVPHRNPPQYPRRLSEFVRRSFLSSAGSESGGPSSSNPPIRPAPSLQEMGLSPGAGNQGRHLPHSRSAMLLERQHDGAFGIPYSLRSLAAAGEGRSRLVSEIRNVLDLMRRGEGLQFEDVMILDQSVFFGLPDIHDRHRDLRLDVDNMSYEELLALEERIGNVNTGLSEETILNCLKKRKYFSIAMGAHLELEPCCICREEYNDGEDIGTLECGHEFHTDCIKQWLMHKNLCPICKTTALNK